MTGLKKREVRLIPDADDALAFKIVDADTGEELTRAEVEELQAVLPPPQAAKTKSMAAQSVKLCGEGDSWLNLLSHISGFPKTLFDVLGETFPTRNLAFPGDTLGGILAHKDYESVLKSGLYRVFVFSAGGNDFIGGGGLASLLKRKSEGHGSSNPVDYVDQVKVSQVFAKLEQSYRLVAMQAKQFEPRILMLIHGYDYALPRKNGKWLGKQMAARGYAHDEPLAPKIIAHLVDTFNEMLKRVDADFAHVRHVNVRGTVNGRWHDELHPKEAAARDIAKLFEKEIKSLLVS
jgi:lysophospholipase L1-like esterase